MSIGKMIRQFLQDAESSTDKVTHASNTAPRVFASMDSVFDQQDRSEEAWQALQLWVAYLEAKSEVLTTYVRKRLDSDRAASPLLDDVLSRIGEQELQLQEALGKVPSGHSTTSRE